MINVENNFEEYKKKLLDCMKAAVKEIEITEIANIQSNTPVLTGNLKRSISSKSNVNYSSTKIRWGSYLIYARKVELKYKSYIRVTLKGDLSNIESICIKHLKEGMK